MALYQADEKRYEAMEYVPSGKSGLELPRIALGLWHNFGDTCEMENMKSLCRTAFDHGITYFDLANNYGPPYGSAERNFGRILAEDFRPRLWSRLAKRYLRLPQLPYGPGHMS